MQPTPVHHTNIMTSHVRHAERSYTPTPNAKEATHPHQTRKKLPTHTKHKRSYTPTPNTKEAKHPHQTHARQVTMADFEEALSKISKSVGLEDIRKHQKWMEEFGAT